AIQKLTDEKRGLERQLTQLRAEIDQRKDLDRQQIERVEATLREKEAEIRELTTTVGELQAFKARANANANAIEIDRRPPRPSTSALGDALAGTSGPVLGCFAEWAQRNPARRATLVVGLLVGGDGRATTPRIVSTPDSHPPTENGVPGRSELEFCVSEQVAGARFPVGFETIEVTVAVHWVPGQIHLVPEITGAHPADAVME